MQSKHRVSRESTMTKELKIVSWRAEISVLVLLPMQFNKLKLEWAGPFQVTRQVTPVDYEVETPGRRQEKKVYHINLLKK